MEEKVAAWQRPSGESIGNGKKRSRAYITNDERDIETVNIVRDQPSKNSWRFAELRRRVGARRKEESETHRVLLDAGRQQVRHRVIASKISRNFDDGIQRYDGETEVALSEMNGKQTVMLRRSEQSWDISKQLRSMTTSVRRAAEAKKEFTATLEMLEQKVLDMRELTEVEINSDDDGQGDDGNYFNEDAAGSKLAMAQAKRGRGRNRRVADAEVDKELALLQAKRGSHQEMCPHCECFFLNEFFEEHVKECAAIHAAPANPISYVAEEALDESSRKFAEMEKAARRKAAKQLVQNRATMRSSFLATVQACPDCGKSVLSSRLKKHRVKCAEEQRALQVHRQHQAERVKQAARQRGLEGPDTDMLGQMPPMPAKNLRMVNVTCDSIELEWDPPVFMGGFNLYVHDYVIEYATCKRFRYGKDETVQMEEQAPLSTTRFALPRPVAARSFVLAGLHANTEYVNIRVRAKNAVGISEPSNAIQVTTDELESPSEPLHLMVARVTPSSIVVVWSEPEKLGGAAHGVRHYVVSYSMMLQKGISGMELTKLTQKVEAPRQCFVVSGMEPNTLIEKISVIAVTEEFVSGEKVTRIGARSEEIPAVRSLEASRAGQIEQELRRLSTCTSDVVDSKVLQGFAQRYDRQSLIRRLTVDLSEMSSGNLLTAMAEEMPQFGEKCEEESEEEEEKKGGGVGLSSLGSSSNSDSNNGSRKFASRMHSSSKPVNTFVNQQSQSIVHRQSKARKSKGKILAQRKASVMRHRENSIAAPVDQVAQYIPAQLLQEHFKFSELQIDVNVTLLGQEEESAMLELMKSHGARRRTSRVARATRVRKGSEAKYDGSGERTQSSRNSSQFERQLQSGKLHSAKERNRSGKLDSSMRQRRRGERETIVEARHALQLGAVGRRRAQFQYRLKKLEEKISELEEERAGLVMRRSMLTKELEREERRVTAFLAEHDRVRAHVGEYIDSSLMHDRPQRFQTHSLAAALGAELSNSKATIANGKQEQIDIQMSLEKTKAQLDAARYSLKDRQARLVLFEKEVAAKQRVLQKVSNWRLKLVFNVFHRWTNFVQAQRAKKKSSAQVFQRMQHAEVYRAWRTWCNFVDTFKKTENGKKSISGLGSYLLAQTEIERSELQGAAAEVLFQVRGASDDLERAKSTLYQTRLSEASPMFDAHRAEHAKFVRDHPKMFAANAVLLKQGQACLGMQKYEIALSCFERHAGKLAEIKKRRHEQEQHKGPKEQNGQEVSNEPVDAETPEDRKARELLEMSECYYGIAVCLQNLGRIDKAIVNYDRTRSLADEAASEQMRGLALLGIAQCNTLNGFYKAAIEYADRALLTFEDLADLPCIARAYRELERAYGGMFDEERQATFRAQAEVIEQETSSKLHDTFKMIEKAERKMIAITANSSTEVVLEVVSAQVPELRRRIEEKRCIAENILAQATKQRRLNQIDGSRLKAIQEQLEVVRACKKPELDSDMVHGIMQRFRVSELLRNLEKNAAELEEVIARREEARRKAEIRASNAKDDMNELENTLAMELGPLMRKVVMGSQRFRCCALNPANLRSRDVTGMATGGVERMVCSIGDMVYVFDLRDGALLAIIDGAKTPLSSDFVRQHAKDPSLPIPGHHGAITALAYCERKIATAGVDKLIRVWEDKDFTCEQYLEGHKGTVWSLWFGANDTIVSGGSDKTVRVWKLMTVPGQNSKKQFKCVRVLVNMHRRSVMCLDVDGKALVSGSPDNAVKVWPRAMDFSRAATRSGFVDHKAGLMVFEGHDCPVTCVRLSANELVTGGEDGRIFIWDVSTQRLLNQCLGHTAAIRSIQVDSTKLVSCSFDKTLCVFDSATGLKLLTLRGHSDQVLACQFDQYRTISVSGDGTMRLWHWSGDANERVPTNDKMHILAKGDTLASLAERYSTTVDKIQKWNNLQDAGRTLYIGMRIIVQKGSIFT